MKKAIAVLLTAAMVLSLAGCTKEETTKKKKKTKKTEDTEDTTEDPTDDPTEDPTDDPTTDTTDEPTAVPSSDTSDTSDTSGSSAPDPQDIEIKNLDSTLYVDCIAYGELVEDNGYTRMADVRVYLETLNIYSDECPGLIEYFDKAYGKLSEDMQSEYISNVTDFVSSSKKANYVHNVRTEMYRDDTYISSFIIRQDLYTKDSTEYSVESHNIFTQTGEEIKLHDVITSTGAIKDLVNQAVPEGQSAPSSAFLNSIDDGTCPFALVYDGIVFFPDEYNVPIKISYYSMPSAFIADYFEKAPEYYVLNFDPHGELVWDFDGDGTMDSLKLDVGYNGSDHFDIKDVSFEYNGNTTTLTSDQCDGMYGDFDLSWDTMYFFHTNNGDYIYMTVTVEDDYSDVHAFKFDNGQFSYVGLLDYTFYGNPCSLENVWMYRRTDLLGTSILIGDFSFNDGDGTPYDYDDLFYNYRNIVQTKQVVKGYSLYSYTDDDIEIPVGAYVMLDAYNPENHEALIEVLSEDVNEIEYVVVSAQAEDYPHTVNDINQDELFDGVFYAG